MMRIASEFGFTAASRSRISAPLPDQLPLLELAAEDLRTKGAQGGGETLANYPSGPVSLVHAQEFGIKYNEPLI